MKLLALELEQFRKFDRPVRLSGFGDQVNVLCGPNEFGKSTILAAIRGLMFERHNSASAQIKRMQTWRGNAAPRVAMEFRLRDGAWRMEKQFLHKPMARLTGPDGGRYDGDAAEEALQRLLGFGAAGKTGAKPEHMGVWGALWVTQRDSVAQADLSSELTRATVNACLDAEVGVLTGQDSGQAVIRAVRDQRAQLLDGNGKPRGRYKEVNTQLEAAAALAGQLERRAEQLAQDAEDLRRAEEKLKRESDSDAEQHDRAALENAKILREAALLHAQRAKTAKAELARTAQDLNNVQAEQARRMERQASFERCEKLLVTGQEALTEAQAVQAAAEAHYAQCRQQVDLAQTAIATARGAARLARAVTDIVRRAALLESQRAALARAEAAQRDTEHAAARLAALHVTQPRLKAIRDATRAVENAQATLNALATRLDIDVLPEAGGKVSIDGTVAQAGRTTRALVDTTEIVIGGIGRMLIAPAIQERVAIDRAIAEARARLAAALLEAGTDTPEQAEARFAERQEWERKLAEAKAGLKLATPGDPASGLAPGIAPLRDQVALAASRMQEERAAAGLAALPSMPASLAETASAEAAELAAIAAQDQATAAASAAAEARLQANGQLARAESSLQAWRSDQARLLQEAAAAEAAEGSSDLAARLTKAEAARQAAIAELQILEQTAPAENAEAMAARVARYEQALTLRQKSIRDLRETIAGLRARIAGEGGHGLDEQIAATRREQEALQREQAHYQREVKIVSLLLETLSSAEKETKERYLAPVIRRVTPYLRGLFPGADIACDDDLRITGLTRATSGAEDFDRLSDGTQEQIAVLSRLAFAEMLIDQGKPAMVILDDALAYADAERMERMFDILTQAAAKTQILVLTCREDLFRRLGGNRVQVEN
jgi:DNA repair exonuclease SbcCD ATPase subunit